MKQILTVLLLLCILCSSRSYSQKVCASTFEPTQVQQTDNARYQRYLQLEQHIVAYNNSLKGGTQQGRLINPNSVITVPVVVHVIHGTGEAIGVGRNISVAQVQSQIDVLNEDFRRLNPDRVNTPNAFTGVAADPNVEFRLACQDPNGNPTNGITRTASTVSAFSDNDNIKSAATGGHDAWPTDRYLNIWVSNLAGGLLGYAQFPFDYSTEPNTDGVVIRTTAFGRIGNVLAPFNTGRTATHEIGHWLDLFHISGDDGNACSGSDQCNDTPNQADENFGCPTFPTASCNNNGDMSMNYMDYSDDACMNIYTNDQRNRMRAVFAQGGPRATFIDNYFRIIQPTNLSVCNTTNLSVSNTSCLPVTWSVISGPLLITAGQSTGTVTLLKIGNGAAIVRAEAGGYFDEISLKAGGTRTQSGTIYVNGSNGPKTTQWGTWNVVEYGLSTSPIIVTMNNPSSTWTYSNGPVSTWWMSGSPNNSLYLVPNPYPFLTNTITMNVSFWNECGQYISNITYFQNYTALNQSPSYSIYPNPAVSSFHIEVTYKDTKKAGVSQIKEIEMIDKMGVVRYKRGFGKGITNTTIDVSSLPNDIYTIRIFDGEQWVISKVSVQH